MKFSILLIISLLSFSPAAYSMDPEDMEEECSFSKKFWYDTDRHYNENWDEEMTEYDGEPWVFIDDEVVPLLGAFGKKHSPQYLKNYAQEIKKDRIKKRRKCIAALRKFLNEKEALVK